MYSTSLFRSISALAFAAARSTRSSANSSKLWIITGKKKRRRVVATPQCIILTDLSISYHYNEHIALCNPGSILCWLSVQVWLCSLNISWFFFVCGCKCRDFFLISNTSRQLFSRAKSLISKDIKSYMRKRDLHLFEPTFADFRVKVSKSQTQLTFMWNFHIFDS